MKRWLRRLRRRAIDLAWHVAALLALGLGGLAFWLWTNSRER